MYNVTMCLVIHDCIAFYLLYCFRFVSFENTAVTGEDMEIQDELYINGAKILPHESISSSFAEPQVMIM